MTMFFLLWEALHLDSNRQRIQRLPRVRFQHVSRSNIE